MKRPLTLLKVLTAVVAVIALFTACKQFLDDPEDFFGYWASETFVKSHNISSAHRSDGAGVQCVGSSADANIMLSVHNPKGFSLVMPSSSASAGIVEFKELSELPTAGTDYDLIKAGSGTLKLTYKEAFLEKYEQGSGNLNPTITLKTTDGRVFKKTYTFDIKSNTPPPKPTVVLAKTNTSSSKYVLCLQFDSTEMTKTVTIGSDTVPVHKDVRKITINDSPYTLLYKGDNSGFQKPAETFSIGSFIESGDVQKLDSSFPNVPSGAWVLYFNTGVAVQSENQQTSYTITLSDAGGVVSDSVTAGLKEKFEVKFNAQGGKPDPDTQYIENNGMVTRPPDPAKLGYIFGGWYTDISYSTQWNFDNDTVTGNMTLYAQWTEQNYNVTYRIEIVDEKAGGTIQAGSSEQTLSGTVSVAHGDSVTFTAHPTNTDWEVAEWSSNVGNISFDKKQATLSNVIAETTVTVKFYQSTLKNPATWKDLARAVKSAPNDATLTINGEIQATDVANNVSRIDVKKNLTIKGENNAVLNAVGKQGIFDVYKTLTLQDITLKNSTLPYNYSGGAGVYVNGNGTLIMKGSSTIENCSVDNSGGGVYVSHGTFEMHDSSAITGCSANKEGGGVYVQDGGTFEMHGTSAITGCTADKGGGVYVSSGTFKMQDSSGITGCSADKEGGGIYSDNTTTVSGNAEIKNNTVTGASGKGGGVYNASHAQIFFEGGTISGNTATTGSGVYLAADGLIKAMTMSGTAKVDTNNDVYLKHGGSFAVIMVTGALTGTAPVARITPELYTEQVVLKAASGSGVTLADEVGKFAVTPDVKEEGIAQAWIIDSAGKLKKSNMEVRYNRLAYYLTTSTHAVVVNGIYRFKIIGDIPLAHLQGQYFNYPGKLAQTINTSGKKVALILPDSIPGLGGMYQCFYGCEYLVSLENIPSGVTSIQECFKGCKNLTKAPVIPSSVTDMEGCFNGCENLTEAPVIPSNVTKIKRCFQDCKALIRAPVIPQGVTDIYSCFQGCENLTQVPNIPSSVTDMGQCFKYCAALTQGPDIPSNVDNMYECFEGCINLRGVKLKCNYNDEYTRFTRVFKACSALQDDGIKVPSGSLTDYQDHADKMGTTADKFSGF